jgi:hypothetical protein
VHGRAAAQLAHALPQLRRLRVSPPAAIDSGGTGAADAAMAEAGGGGAEGGGDEGGSDALAAAAARSEAVHRAAEQLASLQCLAAAFGARLALDQ